MMELLTSGEAWLSLATLTLMEIVLGIDNIVFISVVTSRLPEKDQPSARRIGLAAAMGTRILLLLTIVWIMKLTQSAFALDSLPFGPEWVKWLKDHAEFIGTRQAFGHGMVTSAAVQ